MEKPYHWFARHPIWLLIGVAFIIRILPATVRFVIGSDDGLFLTLGQNLATGYSYTGDGRTIQIDFPPGYPFFAAAIYALGGGLELPTRLNMLLIGSLLPVAIYWLTYQLTDQKTGLMAGLLTALHPALVLAQGNFESVAEQPYSLLLYTGWGLLWWGIDSVLAKNLPISANGVKLTNLPLVRPHPNPLPAGEGVKSPSQREGLGEGLSLDLMILPKGGAVNQFSPRWWAFGLAGVLIGMSHLVRWEGIIMGVMAAGIIVLALRRASLLPVLIFVIGLALFAVPYGWFLFQHTGSPLSPKTMLTQLHAAAIDATASDPYAFERSFYRHYETWLADPTQPPDVVQESRNTALRRYLGNTIYQARLWLTSTSFLTVLWLVPFFIGLATLGYKKTAFLLPLFIPLAAISASVVDPRYFTVPLPIMMIFVAQGWTWLQQRFPTPRLLHRYSLVSLLFGLTLALFTLAGVVGPFLYPRPTGYRAAGLALREQIAPGTHILARKRQIPFYAGGVWEWLPFDDLEGVLAYAQSHDAQYLVVDQFTTPSLRPQLAYLLDPANAPDNLTPVYVEDGVVVYRIGF